MDNPQQLLEGYIDGKLTPEEFASLVAWINADDANAIEFTRIIATHAHLHTHLQQGVRPFSEDEMPLLAKGKWALRWATRRPAPVSWSVATLLIGLLVTAMAIIAVPIVRHVARSHSTSDGQTVAQITGMNNVDWSEGTASSQLKSFLTVGQDLALSSGLLEITFNKGTAVVIAGPANLRLTSDNALKLKSGRLIAKVPSSAVGFAVHTKAGVFIDLGTEFTVGVDKQENATLFVRTGRVAYQSISNKQATVLASGQGVTLSAAGRPSSIESEPVDFATLPSSIKAVNLIRNGSFDDEIAQNNSAEETNNWKIQSRQRVSTSAAPSGNRFAIFGDRPRPGAAIEQEFATTIGTEYVVTYHLSRIGRGTRQPTVTVELRDGEDDTMVLLQASRRINWEPGQWRSFQHNFVATSETTKLRFAEVNASNSKNASPCLDAVSVFFAPEVNGGEGPTAPDP